MSSVHGHEVMQMMLGSEQGFTKDSLIIAIAERFGHDARFHTCSAEDMTAETLIQFLQDKGKFIPAGGGFSTQADKICNH